MPDDRKDVQQDQLADLSRHIPSAEESVIIDEFLTTIPAQYRASVENDLLDPRVVGLSFGEGAVANQLLQQIMNVRERDELARESASPRESYPPRNADRVRDLPTMIALVDDLSAATGVAEAGAVVIRDPDVSPNDMIVLANANADGELLHVAGEAMTELRRKQGLFPSKRTVIRVERPRAGSVRPSKARRSARVLRRARDRAPMLLEELGREAHVVVVQMQVPDKKSQ